jgi:hypothetical protein
MGQKYAAYNDQGAITGFYDSIDSPVPAGHTYIEITDEQWLECLANPGYTVSAGELVAPVPPTDAQLLAQAQTAQIALISAACQKAIYAGFTSSALGVAYTYPASDTDQQNLTASVLASMLAVSSPAWSASTEYAVGATVMEGGQAYVCTTAGESGSSAPTWPTAVGTEETDGTAAWEIWTTPFWCEGPAGVWNYAQHTATQIQQVGLDGKAAITANLVKNKTLAAQIMAAKTVAQVQAIVWS